MNLSPDVVRLLDYHGLLEPVFPLRRAARVRPHTIVPVGATTRVTVRQDPAAVGVEHNSSGVTYWRSR